MRFEEQEVSKFEAVLPRIVVDAEEAFELGAVARLVVEVRVTGVGYEMQRSGGVTRRARFNIEDIQVLSTHAAEDVVASAGGGASAQREQTVEEAAELGLEIRRTGQLHAVS